MTIHLIDHIAFFYLAVAYPIWGYFYLRKQRTLINAGGDRAADQVVSPDHRRRVGDGPGVAGDLVRARPQRGCHRSGPAKRFAGLGRLRVHRADLHVAPASGVVDHPKSRKPRADARQVRAAFLPAPANAAGAQDLRCRFRDRWYMRGSDLPRFPDRIPDRCVRHSVLGRGSAFVRRLRPRARLSGTRRDPARCPPGWLVRVALRNDGIVVGADRGSRGDGHREWANRVCVVHGEHARSVVTGTGRLIDTSIQAEKSRRFAQPQTDEMKTGDGGGEGEGDVILILLSCSSRRMDLVNPLQVIDQA